MNHNKAKPNKMRYAVLGGQLRISKDTGKVYGPKWSIQMEGAGSVPPANRTHFTILSKSGMALGSQSSLLPPPATRPAFLFLNNVFKLSKPVLEKNIFLI